MNSKHLALSIWSVFCYFFFKVHVLILKLNLVQDVKCNFSKRKTINRIYVFKIKPCLEFTSYGYLNVFTSLGRQSKAKQIIAYMIAPQGWRRSCTASQCEKQVIICHLLSVRLKFLLEEKVWGGRRWPMRKKSNFWRFWNMETDWNAKKRPAWVMKQCRWKHP